MYRLDYFCDTLNLIASSENLNSIENRTLFSHIPHTNLWAKNVMLFLAYAVQISIFYSLMGK